MNQDAIEKRQMRARTLGLANRGRRASVETKRRQSLAAQGKKRSPETCARIREVQNRPEQKEMRRKFMYQRMLGNHYTLGKKWTPEQCAEHRIRMNRPEIIANRRLVSKGNMHNLGKKGYHHTPEDREKIRLSKLGKERPDVSIRMSELFRQPEYLENARAKQVETWENPDIAKKRMNGTNKALRTTTHPEARVADVLWQDHLIPGKFEYNGQVDAGITIHGCIPDFVWKNRKLVIEVHGGYYHLRYHRWNKRRATKLKLYQDAGYRLLELWDDELYDDFDPDIVSAKIHGLINSEVLNVPQL